MQHEFYCGVELLGRGELVIYHSTPACISNGDPMIHDNAEPNIDRNHAARSKAQLRDPLSYLRHSRCYYETSCHVLGAIGACPHMVSASLRSFAGC